MKNWKNWLFPLLTCLIAVGLAVLPLWLSVREDSQLSGIVHSEALREDSNFPAKVPELSGRIRLLTQYGNIPDTLTIMEQILEGDALEEAAAQVQSELERLAAAGVLPEESIENLTEFYGSRIFLRNQLDLSSASFLEMDIHGEEQERYFNLYLDGETGRILALNLTGWPIIKYPVTASEIGNLFLEGWEVPYTEVERDKDSRLTTVFLLPESEVRYFVHIYNEQLTIYPEIDWELLEKQLQEDTQDNAKTNAAMGYDS